jgi:hypothetical protein
MVSSRPASIDRGDSGADNIRLIVPVEVRLVDRATAVIAMSGYPLCKYVYFERGILYKYKISIESTGPTF